MNTRDKYFYVMLMSEREDGANEYISDILIKNFKQMFPPSYKAIANVYKINIEKSPKLYGLIRYDHKNKYNITRKSSHIKNIIKSQNENIKNTRFYEIDVLTKYEGKLYKTKVSSVVQKYQFITNDNTAVGDSLDMFIT